MWIGSLCIVGGGVPACPFETKMAGRRRSSGRSCEQTQHVPSRAHNPKVASAEGGKSCLPDLLHLLAGPGYKFNDYKASQATGTPVLFGLQGMNRQRKRPVLRLRSGHRVFVVSEPHPTVSAATTSSSDPQTWSRAQSRTSSMDHQPKR